MVACACCVLCALVGAQRITSLVAHIISAKDICHRAAFLRGVEAYLGVAGTDKIGRQDYIVEVVPLAIITR